jgi:hypothetical protein
MGSLIKELLRLVRSKMAPAELDLRTPKELWA